MFWSIKVLVYFWAFSFLVVSHFWCLFTSPTGHFPIRFFTTKKHVCSCVCVSWTKIRCTLVQFVIPFLVLFQKFMKQYLFKFSLTSSLPSERDIFLMTWSLKTAYSLFVSVNLPLQCLSISFKPLFLVF